MKRGAVWVILTCLLVTSLVLASCNNATTTTTSTSTTTSTTTKTTTTTATSQTSTTTTSSVTTTTSSTGHWWDKLGVPQYGGELTLRVVKNVVNWDPYRGTTDYSLNGTWMEGMHGINWTVDPAEYSYHIGYTVPNYIGNVLAKSWEFTDPYTYVVHLKEGIKYQNIAPVNGRELTSADIVYHYHRVYGGGDGFTKPAPNFATTAYVANLVSVTADGKYTVVFKWNTANPITITSALQSPTIANSIEAREAVEKWGGDLNDWHRAVSTGAFMVKDFVSDSSLTLVKNPDYWGYDERYPQNRLPYIAQVKALVMPDYSTSMAALRTGKLDVLDGLNLDQATALKKTNPELVQISIPLGTVLTIDPRIDVKPFNDMKVRIALQKAIDIATIVKSLYGGSDAPYPGTLTARELKGWTWPWEEWPQSLKDEYTYDPVAAKKILADAGYVNGFKTNVVVSSDVNMDLVQVVKSYFAAIGVDMDIRVMDSAAWSSYVITNRAADQIAMRNQGFLGVNYEPPIQLNKFVTNYRINYVMVSDTGYDALVAKVLASTTIADYQAAFVEINKYVAKQHWAVSLCQPNMYILHQPWLKGYNGQTNSIEGSASFILLFFQYGARFWIDQNVKQSLGR